MSLRTFIDQPGDGVYDSGGRFWYVGQAVTLTSRFGTFDGIIEEIGWNFREELGGPARYWAGVRRPGGNVHSAWLDQLQPH